jgi:hypothetical protein
MTMKTRTTRVERLKKQARRLMLAGDVSRYMSKLRELYETRTAKGGLAIG